MTKRFLTIRFDVTDLTEAEIDSLAFEACVQGEASEGHPDVEATIIDKGYGGRDDRNTA
jgi:hypothetical protein